ncbi:hypothetical protein [uncultured Shewanella sp.]|uniref:hypothetical protein n=1 Tax=uncultured Shewanella sp. TaxID=173975 RepID=UPI002623450A|nr:hypothetical protein [uncultured Shewanella sp.]
MCGNGVGQISGSNVHSIEESHNSTCINGGSFKGRSVSLVQDVRQLNANGSVINGFSSDNVDAYLLALSKQKASNEDNTVEILPKALKERQVTIASKVMTGVVEATRGIATFMRESVEFDSKKNPVASELKTIKQNQQWCETQLKDQLKDENLPKALLVPTTIGKAAFAASYITGLFGYPKEDSKEVKAVQQKVIEFNTKREELIALRKSLNNDAKGIFEVKQFEVNANAIKLAANELAQAREAIIDTVTEQFSGIKGEVPKAITTLLTECDKQGDAVKQSLLATQTYVKDLNLESVSVLSNKLLSFQEGLPEYVQQALQSEELQGADLLQELAFHFDMFDSMPDIHRKEVVQAKIVDAMASREHLPNLKVLGAMLTHFLEAELAPKPDGRDREQLTIAANENANKLLEIILEQSSERAGALNLQRNSFVEDVTQKERVIDSSQILKDTMASLSINELGIQEENERESAIGFLRGENGLINIDIELASDSKTVREELMAFQHYLGTEPNNVAEVLHGSEMKLREVYGKTEGLFTQVLDHDEGLLALIQANPDGYLDMMQQKVDVLIEHQAALQNFVSALNKSENKPELIALFDKKLREVTNELAQHKLFLNVVNEVKLSQDVKGLGANNVERLRGLNTVLSNMKQEVSQTKRDMNLKLYHQHLPLLRKNNKALLEHTPRLRELTLERAAFVKTLEKQYTNIAKEAIENSLSGDSNLKPRLSGQEEQKLLQLNKDINDINLQVKSLDIEYTAGLLELKRTYMEVVKHGGFPEDGEYMSTRAWASWAKQNIAGSWSEDYRPSFQELVLERQLAKNGMESISEALVQLAKTMTLQGEAPLPGQDVVNSGLTESLQGLYTWAQSHPNESIELSANLAHAYSIVASGGASFGAQLADMANNVWMKATVENQVKDLLTGDREILPSTEQLAMTPEMIGLLYLASLAPQAAGAFKGAMGTTALASAALMAVPGLGQVGSLALGGLAGAMQASVENKLADKVANNREREVMIGGVMTFFKAPGTMTQRMEAMKTYMASRETMVQMGTRINDIKEVGVKGTVERFVTDVKNWWSFSTPQAKVLAVATALVTGGIAASAVASAVLLTMGTGGLPIAIASIAGLAAAMSGPFVSGVLIKYAATLDFLGSYGFGLEETARQVKHQMTRMRIDEALDNLKAERKDAEALLLKYDVEAFKERNIQTLAKLAETDQVEQFKKMLRKDMESKQAKLEEVRAIQDRQVLEAAQDYSILHGLDLGEDRSKLQGILSEVDDVLRAELQQQAA